jgi:CheY-like chemotaxis protein
MDGLRILLVEDDDDNRELMAEVLDILTAAESAEKVKPWIEGKTMKKRLYVPKKLVNLVVA